MLITEDIQPDHHHPQAFATAPRQIYMDYNGSTPLLRAAANAMMPFLDRAYGNPSSGHWASDPARSVIEDARDQLARLIGAGRGEIVFTSGATEANNLAISGIFARTQHIRPHIITSAIEHDAILRPVRALRRQGANVTIIPVDGQGIVDVQAIKNAIAAETSLITVMMANNEIGTVQPIAEIGALAAAHGIPFHTDAAQAIGKIPVNVDTLGISTLSIAGHKFGAPNGIGALYIRDGVHLKSPIGDQ